MQQCNIIQSYISIPTEKLFNSTTLSLVNLIYSTQKAQIEGGNSIFHPTIDLLQPKSLTIVTPKKNPQSKGNFFLASLARSHIQSTGDIKCIWHWVVYQLVKHNIIHKNGWFINSFKNFKSGLSAHNKHPGWFINSLSESTHLHVVYHPQLAPCMVYQPVLGKLSFTFPINPLALLITNSSFMEPHSLSSYLFPYFLVSFTKRRSNPNIFVQIPFYNFSTVPLDAPLGLFLLFLLLFAP